MHHDQHATAPDPSGQGVLRTIPRTIARCTVRVTFDNRLSIVVKEQCQISSAEAPRPVTQRLRRLARSAILETNAWLPPPRQSVP
jgi:hypothetical protein